MKKLFLGSMMVITLAMPGLTLAGYEEGYQAAKQGDYATAFKSFKINAENGDVSSQYSLAVMYNDGIGVKKNPKEALYWFRKAAEKGHPIAIEILKRKK